MAINLNNEKKVEEVYTYVNDRVGGFYTSSMYTDYYNRCENREKAYYFKHATSSPVWRSKMYFGIYFMGCKALEASLAQSLRQDPLVQVGLEEGRGYSAREIEQAEIAHFDLNHDLYMGRFRNVNNRIQWYATVLGCGVGREFFTTEAQERQQMVIDRNMFGEQQDIIERVMSRHEHTVTEAVDPRNFAHDPTKSDFWQSRWSSVRYPLPVSDIYKMRGDDRYHQKGVKDLIDKFENTKEPPKWTKGRDTFYTKNDDDTSHQNSVIVDEYSGDLNMSGNYDDNTLYYVLIVRAYNIVLAVRESPFRRHPYWKSRAYPDPTGPWGIDPCAPLLPIGYLKNNIINQYVDYVNSSLKYQYELYDGNIRGGAAQLLTGLPGGLVMALDEQAYTSGPLIRPVNKDKGIPGVGDLLTFIENYEKEVRPASTGRGKDTAASNTATEIGVMAQKEDASIALIQDNMDFGIEDGMAQKMDNRTTYATQPVMAKLNEVTPPIRYFPQELGGVDFTYKIQRVTPDIQAGRYISYLKLVAQGMQMGIVQPEGVARLFRDIGRNMGIDNTDEIIKSPAMPPQIPGQPGDPVPPMQGQAGVSMATEAPALAGAPGQPNIGGMNA